MNARAAVDIGSMSTNLLIVHSDGRRDWIGTVTKLSSGDPAPTIAALRRYRDLIEVAGATQVRAVATEAVRKADDPHRLLAEFADAAGHPIELVDGSTEGKLSALGSTSALGLDPMTTLVVDIGGGSTELVIGGDSISLPLGSALLTAQEFVSDPPRPEELTNALGRVADHLDDAIREFPALATADRVVGVAGTIVVTAAVEIGVMDIDRIHGFQLERAAVEDVFRTLATEPLRDRVHNPGLPADRAEVIVGGLCVLAGLMRKLQLGTLTVSARGLLDGIIAEMVAS